MENTRIRLLLSTIAQESATLRLLSYDPEQLKKQFGLSETDLDALRSVDLLRASELSGRRNPALPGTMLANPQADASGAAAAVAYISMSERQAAAAKLKAMAEFYAAVGMLPM